MRRTSAALLTLLAFLSTLAFVWSGLAKEQTPRPRPTRATTATDPTPLEATATEAEAPTRDLFVFGDEANARGPATLRREPSGAASATASAAAPPPTPEPTPAPRARLVGFLRTADGPSAVLGLDGAVETARVREERRGYRLLALDEETATVRLETPEGEVLELSVATPASPESDADGQP